MEEKSLNKVKNNVSNGEMSNFTFGKMIPNVIIMLQRCQKGPVCGRGLSRVDQIDSCQARYSLYLPLEGDRFIHACLAIIWRYKSCPFWSNVLFTTLFCLASNSCQKKVLYIILNISFQYYLLTLGKWVIIPDIKHLLFS